MLALVVIEVALQSCISIALYHSKKLLLLSIFLNNNESRKGKMTIVWDCYEYWYPLPPPSKKWSMLKKIIYFHHTCHMLLIINWYVSHLARQVFINYYQNWSVYARWTTWGPWARVTMRSCVLVLLCIRKFQPGKWTTSHPGNKKISVLTKLPSYLCIAEIFGEIIFYQCSEVAMSSI